MKFYHKKPIVIEAIQYTGNNEWEIERWSDWAVISSPVLEGDPPAPYLQVLQVGVLPGNLEGIMIANPGDWIICDVDGQHRVCPDNIFRATYEEEKAK